MSAVAEEPAETTLDHVLHVRERVASARFIPIPYGEKGPRLKDWPRKATRDLDMLRKWFGPGGLYTGDNYGVCNVIAIDVDVKNGAPGPASFKALGIPKSTWDTALRVQTPSGGFHLIYSLPEGVDVGSRDGFRPGLDVKAGLSGQVVGAGSVAVKDGQLAGRYEITHDVAAAPCPPEIIELIGKAEPKERKAGEIAPGVELDSDEAIRRAEDLLGARAPAVEGQRGDDWTLQTANLVMDLGISPETCHDLMLDWNDRCSPPWETEGPNSLRTKVGSAYNSRELPLGVSSPQVEFAGVRLPESGRRGAVERRKWHYRHGDPVSHNMRWLLYRRLPLVGTAMIVGPSGGGKTFFLADLARAVAKGEPFFGEIPDERGGVAMFAAEGVAGLPGRLSVLGHSPLPIWGSPVSNLRSAEEQRSVTALLDDAQSECRERFGCPLRVISFDTLAASGLLEDENSNSECALAVKFLEQLATRYECLVVVTHHPPKNGSGARGGSALHAGFDTVIEIHYDGKQPVRRAECSKSRDAPAGNWGCFRLEVQVLGIDERGREDTTCTLVVSAADARSGAALFMDPALVDSIVSEVGNTQWRKDAQSAETSIIDLIAKCAGIDPNTSFGSRQAKDYLGAMLASGALVEGSDRIGGKPRPVVFAPRGDWEEQ